MKTEKVQNEFGFIYYSFIEPNLLVFMGSYVNREHRGKGKFTELANELFSKFPKGTIVQASPTNKKLVNFFEKRGFYRVEKIEYWGSPSNAVCLEGKI
jgi:hypothetical protein